MLQINPKWFVGKTVETPQNAVSMPGNAGECRTNVMRLNGFTCNADAAMRMIDHSTEGRR